MKFAKLFMVACFLISIYVLMFNYELSNIVYQMKETVRRSPAYLLYREAPRAVIENGINILKNTVKESTESMDYIRPIKSVYPTYDTFEAMLDDDAHASNRTFHSSCPYQGLRKPFVARNIPKVPRIPAPKCHRRLLTRKDYNDVVKYFGHYGTMKSGKCNTKNATEICTISQHTGYKREELNITCDASPCEGKIVFLGLFNNKIGKVKWRQVKDINRLNSRLKKHIMSSTFAPGFALLKCGVGIQTLSFPKILKRVEPSEKGKKRRPFNLNIFVEDSLSRRHFYRALLKTTSTFRDIVYNQSIPSTLLEFEKVQSYASSTYYNLQRLFTGRKYINTSKNCKYNLKDFLANVTRYSCTFGLEEMFARYKRAGYSTLLQEDSCWFDNWGSFLDRRERLGSVNDEKTRLSLWKEYAEIVKKSGRGSVVDDHGMSILSCDVYQKCKANSPYSSEEFPNVCFAGRHFGSFFMEYVKKYTELNDMAAQPFIAYTHLLTSHDTNGRRIVNDDESLADTFRHAAHLRNTVTIFASDHGAKATRFAAYTTQGRQEVFQPLLFIIVPHEVSKLLGRQAMNALVLNQNRLVGVEDLYHSLVSILETNKKISGKRADPNTGDSDRYAGPDQKQNTSPDTGVKPASLRGLFAPVPLNRTCEQMKLDSDVLCLCDGMDNSLSTGYETVQWAADFALGALNNRIQEQYTTALRSRRGMRTSGFYGYGACQRYVGTGVIRAWHTVAGLEERLSLSFQAKPYDRKTVEIFDVELLVATKNYANGITLKKLIRVSPFNEYEKCADKGVEPKLCACHSNHHNHTQWRDALFRKVASQKSFGRRPRTQILDKPCLLIVSRAKRMRLGATRWHDALKTYEAVNACSNVTYKLITSVKSRFQTKTSLKRHRPISLLPRTVTFLFTAKMSKFGKFTPIFKFVKRRWLRRKFKTASLTKKLKHYSSISPETS